MKKTYLSKVIHDEDGQTVMLFPEELLKALALKENEILQWQIDEDSNEVRIKRINFIDNSKA